MCKKQCYGICMLLYIETYQQSDGVNELVPLLSGNSNVVLMSSLRSVKSLELNCSTLKCKLAKVFCFH